MANVVGIVAALLALAGGVFAALLLTTNEFVEVFVQEPNDKLSCKIGYLGVYEAGFDAGCLEETTLLESGLGSKSDVTGELSQTIEPFESDTLDFKLLFVAQTDFYTEFSVLETLGLGAAPEFENCEQYVGELAQEPANYVAAAAGITQGVFGAFVDGLTSQVFSNTFADADGVSQLLAGLTQTVGNVVAGSGLLPANTLVGGASPFNVSSYLAVASGVAAAPSLASFPTIKAFIDNTVTAFKPTADASPALDNAIAAAGFANGVTIDFVFNALYAADFNVDQALIVPQVTSMCGALGIATVPCSLVNIATPAQTFVNEGVTLASTGSAEGIASAASLKQGWNGLGLFIQIHSGSFGTFLGTPDSTIITAATSALEVVVKQRASVDIGTLPATWDEEWPVCNLMKTAIPSLSVFPAPCSLERFILSSSAGEVSAEAPLSSFVNGSSMAAFVANELAPDQLGSIESFSGLFDSCFNLFLGTSLQLPGVNRTVPFILDEVRSDAAPYPGIDFSPANCYNNFPKIIIATQYQDADLLAETDFFAAVEKKCDDDALDIEAISNAQTMGPAGTALLFVGAVAGIVTIVKPNKILAVVSAVLCLAGVGLLVGALLGVYNAPVYSAVGGDTDPYDVKYASGVTVTYGIVAMALGGLAGVLFIVSIFTNKGGDNVLEADNKLKPASL